MNINLNITLDTANACLVALSKFPWEQADPHIKVLRAQIEPQVQAAQDEQAAIDHYAEQEKAGTTD